MLTKHAYLFRSLLLSGIVLVMFGCGGGASDSLPDPVHVEEDSPMEVTQQEYDAFTAPADSVLTEEQVTKYLKTALLQFDLLNEHREGIGERVSRMEERGNDGAIANLKNLIDAGKTITEYGDLVLGSYNRSARTLGYNPAELEWVRERIVEAASYMAYLPLQDSMRAYGKEVQEAFSEIPQSLPITGDGDSQEAQVDVMRQLTEAIEQDNPYGNSEALKHNVEILSSSKSNVTPAMWGLIGMSGGTMGWMALAGVNDPDDKEVVETLEKYRRVYTDALENQASTLQQEQAQ